MSRRLATRNGGVIDGVVLALGAAVCGALIGDRFVRCGDWWYDLATAGRGVLEFETTTSAAAGRQADLLTGLFKPGVEGRTLVDVGQTGQGTMFLGWVAGRGVEPNGSTSALAEAVSELGRIVDSPGAVGFRACELTVPESLPPEIAGSVLARDLRRRGYVTVRAAVPLERLRLLRHRHVCLLVHDDCESGQAAEWIAELANASPRAHVLCRLASNGAPRRSSPVSCWTSRVDGAHTIAGRLIADAAFERSDAVLAAVVAEAFVRRLPVPDHILIRQAESHFWQRHLDAAAKRLALIRVRSADAEGWKGLVAWAAGDFEEFRRRRRTCWRLRALGTPRSRFWQAALALLDAADAEAATGSRAGLAAALAREATPDMRAVVRAIALETGGRPGRSRCRLDTWVDEQFGVPACVRRQAFRPGSSVRRAGAPGVEIWRRGRTRMRMLHLIPALLRLIHDAEDEGAALQAACTWLRRQGRATSAAVYAPDRLRVVARDGSCRVGCPPAEPVVMLPGEEGLQVTSISPGRVRLDAPIRYAGRTVGWVVAHGDPDDQPGMELAVQALAALAGPALRAHLDAVRGSPDEATMPEIVGRSPAMAAVREAIRRAAATPFPVLIEGESGTGKELVARALHRLGSRRDRRFLALNCAALTDDLLEAELFGFARGAFTGAVTARAGLFEDAHGGSLFLDEVGELSPRAQAKLLRVLQEREVRRVGENHSRAVDVRVLAATNVGLTEAAAAGKFRQDLLFRLAVVRIRLPPLRDRLEDVPLLATRFWREAIAAAGKRTTLTPEALGALCRHRWPGNVRELQNAMSALAVLAPERGRLGARHVAQQLALATAADHAGHRLDAVRWRSERRAVAEALARHGGRRSAAARELGLSRQGLTKAMRRLGLDRELGSAGVA